MEEANGITAAEMTDVIEDSDIHIQFINVLSMEVTATKVDSNVCITHNEGSYDQSETSSDSSGIANTDSLTVNTMPYNRRTAFDKLISRTGYCNVKCKLCTAVALLCVILLVIGVTQIPITLYYTDPPTAEGIEATLDLVDFQTCWVDSRIQESVISDDILIETCLSYSNHTVDDNWCNTSAVMALQSVYNLGVRLGNNQCMEDGIHFFCNAINLLCNDHDCNSSLSLSKECIQIRDNRCAAEWRIVQNFFTSSLPDCSGFDDGDNTTIPEIPTLPCPDGFEVFCGLCLPKCGSTPYSHGIATAYDALSIGLCFISLIGGAICLIFSIIKRERMLQYPFIFVTYGTIAIQVEFVLITLPAIFGSEKLFCSHDNFLVSANPKESTLFCNFQGFFIMSSFALFFLFWLFHILHMFGSVAFPFKFRHWVESKGPKRRTYLAEMMFILICAFLPATLAASTSGYQFFGFPPVCFTTSGPLMFYAYLLPLTLGSTVTLSVMLVSFCILRRKQRRALNRSNPQASLQSVTIATFSVPEIKLLILFCYYWITIIMLTNSLSFMLRNFNHFTEQFSAFIACSAGGYRAKCAPIAKRLTEGTTDALILIIISNVFYAFVSWANLFFVIQISDIKALFNKLLKKK